MKLTSLQVQNVLGVSSADIRLDKPIALITGKNFSGKSSIQEAVRMALIGESVRVGLKKEYGRLITDGQDTGFAVVELGDGQAAITLPNGTHERNSAFLTTHERALPYVLDAQRFPRLGDKERRGFLFNLMGLSSGGDAVKDRLKKRCTDSAKIDAVMPLLRAGFPAACEEAKNKAREAKASWRTVTSETYGEKKAAGWKAAKPAYDAAALAKARKDASATQASIEAASATLGDLQGQARRVTEQSGRLNQLREQAGRVERIQTKLTHDEAELAEWQKRVDEFRVKAGAAPTETPMSCPHCTCLVVHRPEMIGAELQPYEAPEAQFDADAAARLPEYEAALQLCQNAVTNGKRDLGIAEAATLTLADLEESGLNSAPSEADLIAAQKKLADLKQAKVSHEALIKSGEESERAAATADKKTADAAKHHADVAAWDLIGDALAPDGIPGEMLAEALEPINSRLLTSSTDTEWQRVVIHSDMRITMAERDYPLLSESEKWRADAMIAEAIAHLSGVKLLVLDRFDVLDIAGRSDLLAWLDILATQREIDTALIFGTLKAIPADLPATISAHWIEGGIVGKLQAAA